MMEPVQNNTTGRLLIGLLFFIVIAFLAWGWWNARQEKEELKGVLVDIHNETRAWKDEAGKWNAESKAVAATVGALEASNLAEVREIKEQIGEIKNLVSSTKFNTTTTQRIETSTKDTIVIRDGQEFEGKKFVWKDKFLSVKGLVYDDMALLDYEHKDSYRVTTYWKRERWYKPKVLYGTIKSDNEFTKVDSTSTFAVQPEKKNFIQTWFGGFSVGAAVGLGLSTQIK